MAELVHRTGRRLGFLLGTALLAACAATPPAAVSSPAHPTAAAACRDALGEGWRVAVEMGRADSSTLALESGDSIATCQTWPNAEGTDFVITATGVGLHPASSSALSYLSNGGIGNQRSFFVGRVPVSASAVRVTFASGLQHDAILGGGLWLAWLDQPTDAAPTAIEALNASGLIISRLANGEGVQPAG